MMGMSGCGKSLSVKAISALWNLPLFRLDMNLVFGTENPEQTFHRALKTVEALAPALLWIDEIEMAITGGREAGSEDAVARPDLLDVPDLDAGEARARLRRRDGEPDPPPAGRDHPEGPVRPGLLPRPAERDRAEVDLHRPPEEGAARTRTRSTSSSSRRRRRGSTAPRSRRRSRPPPIEAFNEGRKVSEDDLSKMITNTVPLSRTMDEQIKAIKSWAHDRAMPASKA